MSVVSLTGATVWTELCESSPSPSSTASRRNAIGVGWSPGKRHRPSAERGVWTSSSRWMCPFCRKGSLCVCPMPQVRGARTPAQGGEFRLLVLRCPSWTSRLHWGQQHPGSCSPDPGLCSSREGAALLWSLESVPRPSHRVGRRSHTASFSPQIPSAYETCWPLGPAAWQLTPLPRPLGLAVSLGLPARGWGAIPEYITCCSRVLRGLPSAGPLSWRKEVQGVAINFFL